MTQKIRFALPLLILTFATLVSAQDEAEPATSTGYVIGVFLVGIFAVVMVGGIMWYRDRHDPSV